MSETLRAPGHDASDLDSSPPAARRRPLLAILFGLILTGLAVISTLQPVGIINQRVPHFFIGRTAGFPVLQPESPSRIRVYADESLRRKVRSYMAENNLTYEFVPDSAQADISLLSSRYGGGSQSRRGADSTAGFANLLVAGQRQAAADRAESMSAMLDQILAYPLAHPRAPFQDPERADITVPSGPGSGGSSRPGTESDGSSTRDSTTAGAEGSIPIIPPRPSYDGPGRNAGGGVGGDGGGGNSQQERTGGAAAGEGARRAVLAAQVAGPAGGPLAPALPDGAIFAIGGDDREVIVRIVPALVVVRAGEAQSFDLQVLTQDDRWYSVTRREDARFRIIGDRGGIRRHAREKNRFALPLSANELLHGGRVIIEGSYSPAGYETGYARSIIIQQVPGAITTPDTVTR